MNIHKSKLFWGTKVLTHSQVGRVGYRGNMVLATCAGACMQLTTLPLQNHSTRMQTQTEKRGNWATALAMYREEGLGAFYKGLLPCLLLSLNATIQDTIFEGIKDAWLKRQNLSAAAKAGVDLAQMKLREVQVGAVWKDLCFFLVSTYICISSNIFQRGWHHQKDIIDVMLLVMFLF